MRRSVVVALLLLVGGCAGGFGAPSVEATKTIGQARTVGVISAVGSKFALQKMGITVFGNELNEVAVDAWGIDDAVVNKVGALLNRRYAVRRVTYPKGAFADSEDLQGVVRRIAAAQKFDLYVIVTRASAPFGSSNQIVTGLGMIEAGGVINPDNVTLFAVSTVHVYDGRTFERLGWQRIGSDGISLGIGKAINAPTRTLDRTWWPATPQAVHNDKLKSATRTLMDQGLAATIPQIMGLTKQAGAI
jgi:hypothetical protein